MCCRECAFCNKLKIENDEHHVVDIGSVCVLFPKTEKGYDSFALIIKNPYHDCCEEFCERTRD